MIYYSVSIVSVISSIVLWIVLIRKWNLLSLLIRHLQVDHDVCSNYGNWLYSAGVGNDPRQDRKFNMVKQGLDYDPQVYKLIQEIFME